MTRAKILVSFRVRAGPATGMGHLMRCCALAVAFQRLSNVRCFFEREVLDLARNILANRGVLAEDAAGAQEVDVLVADIGPLDTTMVQSLRQFGRVVVSIEDTPHPVVLADVLIRPNTLPLRDPKGAAAVLAGPDFLLLFPMEEPPPRPFRPQVQRVLICFGGSDPADLSRRTARILARFGRRADYRLVIGPHYGPREDLRSLVREMHSFTLLERLYSLADEMAMSDLALISGGTLVYEACALGRPALVISQNEEQAKEADHLALQGAIEHAGSHDGLSDQEILVAIRDLWDDPHRRAALSTSAARLIPRDGAERAAAAILEHLNIQEARSDVNQQDA